MVVRFRRYSFREILLLILLLFLPFGQALTFNLSGIPVKISEVSFIIYILISVFWGEKFLFEDRVWLILAGLLLLVNVSSLLVNLFSEYNYPLSYARVRNNYIIDSLSKVFYVGMSLTVFLTFIRRFCSNKIFVEVLMIGGVITSLYSIYLNLASQFNFYEFLLPGMDEYPQRVFSGAIRCSTFKEGNYFGLFILILIIISSYERKYKYFIFFSISIFTSYSTIAIACSLVYIVLFSFFELINKSKFKELFFVLILFFFTFFLIFSTKNVIKYILVSKITGTSVIKKGDNQSTISKKERTESSFTAFKIGLDNPIIGVGPSNYSLHFDEYYNDYSLKGLGKLNSKAIPNNVYMEIFSELGLLGMFVFLSLMIYLFYLSLKIEFFSFGLGFLLILINLLAFPTYNMLYLWVFFAYTVDNSKLVLKKKN